MTHSSAPNQPGASAPRVAQQPPQPTSSFQTLWKTEDWWSVWLGLGLVLLALAAFWGGSSIKSWALMPAKLTSFSKMAVDFTSNAPGYLTLFIVLGSIFTFSAVCMGHSWKQFVPGFVLLFVGSLLVFYIAGWKVMEDFNIEAPLLALLVGLVISNAVRLPAWLKPSLRTEYYIKTGIVLLGATLPFTLIISAGPVAILQAAVVSIATWITIFLAATRIFKLDPQFGAVLGAGGSVCGVSAAIAVAGAVRAKKEHTSISIGIVTVWAVIMIFALSFSLKHLVPEKLSPGVAGAIVGTSEFADAAGLAVAAELATRFGDAPIHTFTLMKVIGRDIWIGIWCLVLAVISVTCWESNAGEPKRKVGAGIVWERFPKFVFGFLAASSLLAVVSASAPAGYIGTAKWEGQFNGKAYKADFSTYQPPAEYADRLTIDASKKTLAFKGVLSAQDLQTLSSQTKDPDQIAAFRQLSLSSKWFDSVLTPNVIGPIKKIRSWAFVLCFLCIGLTTRFADLLTFGMKPFWAFTLGVLVNVPLGIVLSKFVFARFWNNL